MLYRWNQRVCNLRGFAFSPQRNSLALRPSRVGVSGRPLSRLRGLRAWVPPSVLASPCRWAGALFPGLRALTNKGALSMCVQVLCELKLSFLWDKCSRVYLLGLLVSLIRNINACFCVLSFIGNCPAFAVAVGFYIHTSNI